MDREAWQATAYWVAKSQTLLSVCVCVCVCVHQRSQILLYINCCYCLFAKLCLTLLRHHGLQPAWLLCPWDFPGMNTSVGCHFLLQGIFPAQGLNPRLLH